MEIEQTSKTPGAAIILLTLLYFETASAARSIHTRARETNDNLTAKAGPIHSTSTKIKGNTITPPPPSASKKTK